MIDIEKEADAFLKHQNKQFSNLIDFIEYSNKYDIFRFKMPNTILHRGEMLGILNYGWKMWTASISRENK